MYRGRYRLSFQVWGGNPSPSRPQTIKYSKADEGEIRLTYETVMASTTNSKGHTKYQGIVRGKFQV